tara:strand:+ start:13111 stop:13728 length:618 start_codon:yes stop_codon:yes gene_type:complete
VNRLIYLTEDIMSSSSDSSSGDSLIKRISKEVISLNLINPQEPIHVLIDTDGGNVKTALSLYDIFKASVCPIYTYALSEVSSAGILIFAVGTKRFCFSHSLFMTHPGSIAFTSNDLEFEHISELMLQQGEMAKSLIKKVLKLSNKNYNKLFSKTTYFWATEAKRIKLVTKILTEWPASLLAGIIEYEIEPIMIEARMEEGEGDGT